MSNKSIQTNKLRLISELPLSGAHHTAVQSYSSQRWAVTCTFVVLWLGRLIWSNSKHRLHFWQSAHVLWRTLDNPLTDLCHNLQFALLEILSYLVLFLIGSFLDIFVGVGLYVMLFGRTKWFKVFESWAAASFAHFICIQSYQEFVQWPFSIYEALFLPNSSLPWTRVFVSWTLSGVERRRKFCLPQNLLLYDN